MRRGHVTATTLIAAALLAVACDTPTPNEPAAATRSQSPTGQLHSMADGGADAGAPGQVVACSSHAVQFDTATIGPSGGTLVVGNSRLIVPPGALLTPTLISGTIPDTSIAIIQFEPTGLHFGKPAGLQLDVSGCNPPQSGSPAVVYVDENGNVQERIDAVFSNDWHTVAAPIEHFSGYAFAF